MNCTLCPKNCNVDRKTRLGVCRVGNLTVSRIAKHMWEEPCISGEKGSGTIFFAGCNLHCRFCQNYDISVIAHGVELTERKLADVFLYMQDTGAANINLVTPSQFSNKIAQALELAKPKLNIPVVYNTSSYEKVEAIQRLNGLVDVYLPDLKFASEKVSTLMCNTPDYFTVAAKAICEMLRQKPQNVFDINGYIQKGVIVRHLVLPGFVEDSKTVLDYIATTNKETYVSLMSQYFVARKDDTVLSLNRKLYKYEYENIKQYFFNVGLKNGYFQDLESATVDYLPEFSNGQVEEVLKQVPQVF